MKKTLYATAAVFVLLLISYIGLWIYSARWFTKEIDHLYASAAEDGVTFLGPKPTLTNFPFVPEVLYMQGIQAGNASILFPEMHLRGYPVPFTTLKLAFPGGISLAGIADPAIWSLDSLDADVAIPYSLPATFEHEDLEAWHALEGKLELRDYKLVKRALISEGEGMLTLDDQLQPVFTLVSTVKGHEAFIKEQSEQALIDPFAAAIGTTILNGLARPDEKTGEKIVTLNVNVKDRMLSVGPLQVLELPEIVWDRRTPLDPPQ